MYDLLKVVSLLVDERKRSNLSQSIETDKNGNVFISGVQLEEAIRRMEIERD